MGVLLVIIKGPALLGICVVGANPTRTSYCRTNDLVACIFYIAYPAVPAPCSVTIAIQLSTVLLDITASRCFRCL